MKRVASAAAACALAAVLAVGATCALGSAHGAKTNSSLGLDENWLTT